MPLHWTISHPQRMVLAVAKGQVAPHEFGDYIAAVDEAKASSYAKLFDITGLTGDLGEALLKSVARAVQNSAAKGPLGPIAIVASSDRAFFQAQLYAQEASVARPLKIFRELHEARRWLDGLSVEATPGQ
jgi:hypothetical protein